VGKISDQQRERNERAIREAMDRLLRGELPPGGRCDLKTLATEAGITRTGFYSKKDRNGLERPGPYQHLAEEFERRLKALRDAGEIPDPRDAQIARQKDDIIQLNERISRRDAIIEELTKFKELALSRLAAQHDDIIRLRERAEPPAPIRPIPRNRPPNIIGTCS
jgi:hypothetical protein